MHSQMIETVTYQDRDGNKPYADWLGSLSDKQGKARAPPALCLRQEFNQFRH